MDEQPAELILLGQEELDQTLVEELAFDLAPADRRRYEGIDERVIEELEPLEISIGDYVLSGGELPALTLMDALVPALSDMMIQPQRIPSLHDEQGRRPLDALTTRLVWKDKYRSPLQWRPPGGG